MGQTRGLESKTNFKHQLDIVYFKCMHNHYCEISNYT